jgi:hypothetical protein
MNHVTRLVAPKVMAMSMQWHVHRHVMTAPSVTRRPKELTTASATPTQLETPKKSTFRRILCRKTGTLLQEEPKESLPIPSESVTFLR